MRSAGRSKGLPALTVAIPPSSPTEAIRRGVGRSFSPSVSPTSGPIGDLECQRRDSLRRRLEVYLDLIRGSELDALSEGDFVLLVLEGLSDTWSEIRGDTAKALASHCQREDHNKIEATPHVKNLIKGGSFPYSLCHEILHKLIGILETKESEPSWQNLHGALIGLYPFLNMATSEQQDVVQTLCLSLQRHSRLPVREAARKCFGRLLFIRPDGLSKSVDLVLQKISDILAPVDPNVWDFPEDITTSRTNNDISYYIDGLLCSIGIIINASSNLGDVSSVEKIISIVSGCLCSASSTVRQSAGQNLLSLLRKTNENLAETQNSSSFFCKQAVYQSITSQLNDRSPNKWPQHEASLLVGEDIIRNATLLRLQKGDIFEIDPSFCALLETLFNCSEYSLQHAKFEMRRVGAQLLPPLMRAIVLFVPGIVRDFILASMEASNKQGDTLVDMSQNSQFLCVIVSEIAKICQHFREIVDESNEVTVLLGHRWALEVQGRHMEDENRVSFHLALRKFCSSSKDLHLPLLYNKFDSAVSFLEGVMDQVRQRCIRPGGSFCSCDYTEACALYSAVTEKNQPEIAIIFTEAWFVIKAAFDTTRVSAFPVPARLAQSLMDPSSNDLKRQSLAGFISANRWICEAVGPVITVLVFKYQSLSESISQDFLVPALVVSSWIMRGVSDPLWLDRRPAVRRGLFEALPALLKIYATNSIVHANIIELADITGQTFTSLSSVRNWDSNELYQVLKLINSVGYLFILLRLAEEGGIPNALKRKIGIQSKLTGIRDRLASSQSRPRVTDEAAAASASKFQTPGSHEALQFVRVVSDRGELGRKDEEQDDDILDEFSDWDEESNDGELSVSESGGLTCDIITVLKAIEDILG